MRLFFGLLSRPEIIRHPILRNFKEDIFLKNILFDLKNANYIIFIIWYAKRKYERYFFIYLISHLCFF